MIQTKAKKLHQLIEKKQTLRLEKDHIELYKTRKEQVEKEVGKIVKLYKMINIMWEYNICSDEYKEEMQSLYSISTNLKEQFIEKPEWIKNQGALRSLKLRVESVTEKIQEEVKIEWGEFLEKDLPVIHNEMLSILAKIPSFSLKVKKIRGLYQEILDQKEQIPQQEKELLSIENKKKELISEWNSLGAEDVPADVLKFIRSAASNQGEELQNLTPEVFIWLKQYNIQSFFKIRL